MNYQFTQLGVYLSTLMPTVSEAAVNLVRGPIAAEVLQHPFFQNCYYVPPSLRTRATFDRTPPSTRTGRCVEQRSATKYSAPGALPNAKTTSPKSHVTVTVQRKLEMDGKDFNRNEKSMQNSVRQPKYQPPARSSSFREDHREPWNSRSYREVVKHEFGWWEASDEAANTTANEGRRMAWSIWYVL